MADNQPNRPVSDLQSEVGLAQQFAAYKVLQEAKQQLISQVRWVGLACIAILGLAGAIAGYFGVSTWMGIDEEVDKQVRRHVDEALKQKDEEFQQLQTNLLKRYVAALNDLERQSSKHSRELSDKFAHHSQELDQKSSDYFRRLKEKSVKSRQSFEKQVNEFATFVQAQRGRVRTGTEWFLAHIPTELSSTETLTTTVTVTNRKRLRPLVPGASVSRPDGTPGTICCFVKQRTGDTRFLLTADHVLAHRRAKPGDPIIQPGSMDGGRVENDQVAKLIRWTKINSSEANRSGGAIAELLDGIEVTANQAFPIRGLADAVRPGQRVEMIGRTTGVTTGVVVSVGATISLSLEQGVVARYTDMIMVRGLDGDFSVGGDSGAPVVTEPGRQLIGMVYGGSTQFTIVIPIRPTLQELEVELVE